MTHLPYTERLQEVKLLQKYDSILAKINQEVGANDLTIFNYADNMFQSIKASSATLQDIEDVIQLLCGNAGTLDLQFDYRQAFGVSYNGGSATDVITRLFEITSRSTYYTSNDYRAIPSILQYYNDSIKVVNDLNNFIAFHSSMSAPLLSLVQFVRDFIDAFNDNFTFPNYTGISSASNLDLLSSGAVTVSTSLVPTWDVSSHSAILSSAAGVEPDSFMYYFYDQWLSALYNLWHFKNATQDKQDVPEIVNNIDMSTVFNHLYFGANLTFSF